jgi:sugar/nucleoside kinase (ribokinase family)
MYDIITFGSATRDIFLRTKQFLISKRNFKKEILLPLGLKINVSKIYFYSGGGGINVAATLAKQGLKTAFCGTIGKDFEGLEILKELKERKIERKFISFSEKPTDVSVIFSTPKERTILVYKGASKELGENYSLEKTKNTKWFYLTPLSGKWLKEFSKIVNFAKKNQIKVMINPGNLQLNLPQKILYSILKKADILILNLEEGQLLSRSRLKGEKLVLKIREFFPGILIITNGEKKIFLAKENQIISVLPPKIKILDKTGAGDAFGAAFLSGFIKSQGDLKFSLELAIENAAFCMKKWGAKEGILEKNKTPKKLKIYEIA